MIPYAHTSHYCEENVWHLAKQKEPEGGYGFVVIISNENRTVPFWRHRSSITPENPEGMVIWDYHVIYIHDDQVYDYDSDVPFPCPVWDYIEQVLGVLRTPTLPDELWKLYRIIPAPVYLKKFASDRSHMLLDGKYLRTPPSTPCIVGEGGVTMNLMQNVLMRFFDVDREEPLPMTMGHVHYETSFIDLCRSLMDEDEDDDDFLDSESSRMQT
ncbi:Putative uncharacterized protein [Taphrina deformans PYCC 5710]|uniref:Protein N-terminal glutamine amidohydrolase n=1 Tax=Taphrina deformans (strain PYCC 5710 / ATCC 11124 / CBS 356.35 / IMI 108563 / JCM 9778 / NBRC 8474) TaxID=1097556 RepID=R4X8J9_TAPDE|nr:Putative uncharacterized protein [Taphrina deformans PYCC 5710]|eukprot:CCG81665.1 Putative uncharacterized protein [Taphrina deformans PYCC 5710]